MSKNKIADKIARLRRMTVENGASEAEAAFAAERASQLALEHEISEAEIAAAGDQRFSFEIDAMSFWVGRKKGGKTEVSAEKCALLVAKLFSCRAVVAARDGGRKKVVFVGDGVDLELCLWVFGVISDALDRETVEFKRTSRGHPTEFALGFVYRINERLKALIDTKVQGVAAAGGNLPALVDAKALAVADRYAELFPNATAGKRFSYGRATETFRQGMRRGDAVHLGAAIGASGVSRDRRRLS